MNYLNYLNAFETPLLSQIISDIDSDNGNIKPNQTQLIHKPFACSWCNYSTSSKAHLVDHSRTHSGEKPFSCDQCDYKCNVASNLRRHNKQRHSNRSNDNIAAPLLSCNVCDYETYNWSDMQTHEMFQHVRQNRQKKVFDIFDNDGKLILQVVHYES